MHADYYFLANFVLDKVTPERVIHDRAEAVMNSYAVDHCREDNGWHIENVVLHPDSAPVATGQHNQIPDLWSETWLETMMAVVSDFSLNLEDLETRDWDRMIDRTPPEPAALTDAIHGDMPARIARQYQYRANGGAALDNTVTSFRRRQISQMYELFSSPLVSSREPFTDWIESPYDYRAYDLTDGKPGNAIIRVDIHT